MVRVLGESRATAPATRALYCFGFLALLNLVWNIVQLTSISSESLDRSERLSSLSILPRTEAPVVDVERQPGVAINIAQATIMSSESLDGLDRLSTLSILPETEPSSQPESAIVTKHRGLTRMPSEGSDQLDQLSSHSMLPKVDGLSTLSVLPETEPSSQPESAIVTKNHGSTRMPSEGSDRLDQQSSHSTPPKAEIVDFERQPGAAIVTKIHGPHQFHLLEQSLCLLHYAYNARVRYDIVVFVTDPLSAEEMGIIRNVTHPARVSFPPDNRGSLQAEIAALSPVRRDALLARCRAGPDGITHVENITWWSNCPDRLAYNWQAEFRGWRLWHHAALRSYRYMLWLDADVFATKVWAQDPVAYAIRHRAVAVFDNMFGVARGINPIILQTYNKTICKIEVANGRLATTWRHGSECVDNSIHDIHGFFHVTDLEFYRSGAVAPWLENLPGDCFCCREPDDQIAMTVPAALLAPNRSHDLHSNGIRLDLFHNCMLDGKDQAKPAGFREYYREVVRHNFSETVGVCRIRAGK